MKITETCVYFYSNNDHFSNFYKSSFVVNDIEFNCGEQYIMYSKALLFKDNEIVNKILQESVPSKIKALGRKVKNYNDKIWCEIREDITYIGLLAKYMQNNDLKKLILDTGDKELVEASPYDKVWGIGMGITNPNIHDKTKWGTNILGKILMRVRNNIRNLEFRIDLFFCPWFYFFFSYNSFFGFFFICIF